MISLAQGYAVSAQTRLREASVFDQDCMQADDLIKRQGSLAGLYNRLLPTRQSVARILLALNLNTGAAVYQQKKTRGARNNTGSGLSDHLIRFATEIAGAERFERLRSANDRTKRRGAEQVV